MSNEQRAMSNEGRGDVLRASRLLLSLSSQAGRLQYSVCADSLPVVPHSGTLQLRYNHAMTDDSGTHKLKLSDLKEPQEQVSGESFSKDEIDSLADLIGGDEDSEPNIDLEDTGRFKR